MPPKKASKNKKRSKSSSKKYGKYKALDSKTSMAKREQSYFKDVEKIKSRKKGNKITGKNAQDRWMAKFGAPPVKCHTSRTRGGRVYKRCWPQKGSGKKIQNCTSKSTDREIKSGSCRKKKVRGRSKPRKWETLDGEFASHYYV